MKTKQIGGLAITLLSAIALHGCGGGGSDMAAGPIPTGSSTLSGVAAVGAPVNGGTVSVISSIGELIGTATTSPSGKYSFDYPANKSGPFLIEVRGGTYIETTTGIIKNGPRLHSIANSAGTANITPLTEMIVAQTLPPGQTPDNAFQGCQAAGQSGSGVGTSCTPNFSTLDNSHVTAAQNQLLAALGNAITSVGGGITDLIHQPFDANSSSPMDILLDATKPVITVVNNTPTISMTTVNGACSFGLSSSGITTPTGVTITDGKVVIPNFDNDVTTTKALISSYGQILATAAADLAEIQAQMDALASLFSSGMPSQSTVIGLLDAPNFLMDGMNATAYAQQLTTAPSSIVAGDYFVVTLASVFDNSSQQNSISGTKWVNAMHFNGAHALIGQSRIKFVKNGTVWLMAGNERTVQIGLRAESGMASAGSTTFSSDVNFAIDPTSASNSIVALAVVTGPSVVPSTGVAIYTNATPGTPASALMTNQIPLCDSVIVTNCTNAVDGATYTITLQDVSNTVLAIYNETLSKAPLPATTLTAAMFPAIGTPLPSSIAGINPGGSLVLTWTTPNGLIANWVDYSLWDTNGMLVFQLSGPPSGNNFVGVFPSFSLSSGIALSRYVTAVEASDVYGRQYISFQ